MKAFKADNSKLRHFFNVPKKLLTIFTHKLFVKKRKNIILNQIKLPQAENIIKSKRERKCWRKEVLDEPRLPFFRFSKSKKTDWMLIFLSFSFSCRSFQIDFPSSSYMHNNDTINDEWLKSMKGKLVTWSIKRERDETGGWITMRIISCYKREKKLTIKWSVCSRSRKEQSERQKRGRKIKGNGFKWTKQSVIARRIDRIIWGFLGVRSRFDLDENHVRQG